MSWAVVISNQITPQLARNSTEGVNPFVLEVIRGADSSKLLETAMWFLRSFSSNNVFDFKLESLEALLFHHCDEETEPQISSLLCREEARELFEYLRTLTVQKSGTSLREAISSVVSLVQKVDAGSANLLKATFSKTAAHYQRRLLLT